MLMPVGDPTVVRSTWLMPWLPWRSRTRPTPVLRPAGPNCCWYLEVCQNVAGLPSTARGASSGFSPPSVPWGSKSRAVMPVIGATDGLVEDDGLLLGLWLDSSLVEPSGVLPRPRLK